MWMSTRIVAVLENSTAHVHTPESLDTYVTGSEKRGNFAQNAKF